MGIFNTSTATPPSTPLSNQLQQLQQQQGMLYPTTMTTIGSKDSNGTHFSIEEAENGYIVYSGGKSHIAKDCDEILELVKLILVSNKVNASR